MSFMYLLYFSKSCLLYFFQHGAAVIQDKMYIYGGNHNGRYLGDLHVSNLYGL